MGVFYPYAAAGRMVGEDTDVATDSFAGRRALAPLAPDEPPPALAPTPQRGDPSADGSGRTARLRVRAADLLGAVGEGPGGVGHVHPGPPRRRSTQASTSRSVT